MTKNYLNKLIVSLAFLTLPFTAQASAAIVVDGLVSDWGVTPGAYGFSQWTPNSGVFSAIDDQNPAIDFLSPGWGGQKFDVEAIYFKREADMAFFAVVSGFPLEGRFYQGQQYYAGDFALDFGNDGSYEFGVETFGPNQGKLYGDAQWTNPLFIQCGPYALSNGTFLGNTQFAYDNTTYIGNEHYVFEFGIPISLFGSYWDNSQYYIPEFTAHWTMSCGNNCLNLTTSSVPNIVPEPATTALFLIGLTGLAAGSLRKRFQLKK